MSDYYKVYHFSAIPSLDKIDPAFFGTGICYAEYKHGALGIQKSYYFISTTGKLPERSGRPYRYEVYLPCGWKIYDLDKDPEGLLEKAKKQIAEEKMYPYNWLVNEKVEKLILESGYHGRLHADGIAIALFSPLSTRKPDGPGRVYEFSADQKKEILLEELPIVDRSQANNGKVNVASANSTFFYRPEYSCSKYNELAKTDFDQVLIPG